MARWNYEKVKKFVNENSNCQILSDTFNTTKDKYVFECKCGEEFETTFERFNLKNKRQCDKCGRLNSSKKQRLSYDYIKTFIEDNSECKILSDSYINNNEKILLLCSCGESFYTTFDKFKTRNKRMCNQCSYKTISESQTFSYEQVKEYIESESSCKMISHEYNSCYDIIRIACECGKVFETTLANFKAKKSKKCNKCSNLFSEGESLIAEFLEGNNIKYKEQFTFKDLTSDYTKHLLRFDFCVLDDNDEPFFFIEFDGRQHFEPIEYFGGLESYEILKRNDHKKEQYCIKNEFKLLRIPYYSIDDINSILQDNLRILCQA